MKLVHTETLIAKGDFCQTREWSFTLQELHTAIGSVVWPPGTSSFTIHPESGKKRGEGNGVRPIRDSFVAQLERDAAWNLEQPVTMPRVFNPGDIDAIKRTDIGWIAVEWETGNVASSHRSLNKLALLLQREFVRAGVLVVPSKRLAAFLTDRIGNFEELRPYFSLWSSVPISQGFLGIMVVEHDAESRTVPRIRKGTDGRAIQ
ncbi:MAG: Type-2 restriction enzyme BamHI [Planctomycetota bacterium]